MNRKHITCATILMLLTLQVPAQTPHKTSDLDHPLAIILLVIAGALLVAIVTLGFVLTGAADIYLQRFKEEQKKKTDAAKVLTVTALCLLSATSFAQEKATDEIAASANALFGGLSPFSFYALCTVIGIEVMVILVMAYYIKTFIAKEKALTVTVSPVVKTQRLKKLWQRMNNFKTVQEEKTIVIDHNYDGIQELDNSLPRWWVYGFYLTILFGIIYIYRFHISHSALLPAEELQLAMQQAEQQKEVYLKTAAAKIDENTVTINTDASFIAEGQKLFVANCAPCHGDKGQGVVGPNLTDDYWLHKGSINDIFKTIKYGYPEKGMKSWKDDFAPVQIARIANYIKTLHGTNPAGGKEPQGELYAEPSAATNADSAKHVTETGKL